VAALREYGRPMLADLLAAEPDRPITELLLVIGRSPDQGQGPARLSHRRGAGRRPAGRAGWPGRCADYTRERADWLAGLVRAAQGGGELDPRAVAGGARPLLPAAGHGPGALVPPDMHTVGDEEWATLLARVASALAPAGATAQTGAAQ